MESMLLSKERLFLYEAKNLLYFTHSLFALYTEKKYYLAMVANIFFPCIKMYLMNKLGDKLIILVKNTCAFLL